MSSLRAAAILLLGSLLVLTGNVVGGAGQIAKFPTQESGYWTCVSGRHKCIYWLDDERVLFNGAHPDEVSVRGDGHREWRHANYVWSLRENRITKLADAQRASLCYSEGFVRYEQFQGDELVVKSGVLGEEKEVERLPNRGIGRARYKHVGWDTDISCGQYLPQTSLELRGHKVALGKGDGFLYLGDGTPSSLTEPVLYFPDGQETGTALPIQRWQLRPATVLRIRPTHTYLVYGPYRRGHLGGIVACPETRHERNLYILTVDGSIKTIVVPALEPLRCYTRRFDLARDGVLAFSGGGHSTDLDRGRLYLLAESTLFEVVRGVVTDYAVSPSGCRIAVGIGSKDDRGRPPNPTYRGHLKVINLCSQGER